MAESSDSFDGSRSRVTLSDGTLAMVRPIRADGGAKLLQALAHLSPESRYQRFLHEKTTFTPSELHYLTHCDGLNHLAFVLVTTDAQGREQEPIAVARCIRDVHDPAMAEVAIVVADEWQGKGVGKILFQALAKECAAVGIERWQALLRASNSAAFRLMDTVGTRQSERPEYVGTLTVTYQLHPSFGPPAKGAPAPTQARVSTDAETEALLKVLRKPTPTKSSSKKNL